MTKLDKLKGKIYMKEQLNCPLCGNLAYKKSGSWYCLNKNCRSYDFKDYPFGGYHYSYKRWYYIKENRY